MSLLLRLNRISKLRNVAAISQSNSRLVSTTPKKSDTATVVPKDKVAEEPIDFTDHEKNWVTWGWDLNNKQDDRDGMNSSFFFSVTIGLVCSGFYLAYTPDNFRKDWAQREAFLLLREREAAGLPAIDPNYVDPAQMILPSDEELGDEEIII